MADDFEFHHLKSHYREAVLTIALHPYGRWTQRGLEHHRVLSEQDGLPLLLDRWPFLLDNLRDQKTWRMVTPPHILRQQQAILAFGPLPGLS